MEANTILTVVLAVFALAILAGAIYFYLKDKTLGEIRADVYQLFLRAENNPKLTHKGKQKMKWVLQRTRCLLPKWAQVLIPDTLLEKIVQSWFDAVKDLLDDGRVNGSCLETEE